MQKTWQNCCIKKKRSSSVIGATGSNQFPVLASVHYICITSDYLRSKELSISSIKVSHSFDFVPEFVHMLDSLFF